MKCVRKYIVRESDRAVYIRYSYLIRKWWVQQLWWNFYDVEKLFEPWTCIVVKAFIILNGLNKKQIYAAILKSESLFSWCQINVQARILWFDVFYYENTVLKRENLLQPIFLNLNFWAHRAAFCASHILQPRYINVSIFRLPFFKCLTHYLYSWWKHILYIDCSTV